MNIETVREHMMQKNANWGAGWLKAPLLLFGTTKDVGMNAALYVLGAAALAGGGIGAFGAHITAHGKQDEDTVKKEYENERLKADVGYVASRLQDEFNRSKDLTKPKAARVLNVR